MQLCDWYVQVGCHTLVPVPGTRSNVLVIIISQVISDTWHCIIIVWIYLHDTYDEHYTAWSRCIHREQEHMTSTDHNLVVLEEDWHSILWHHQCSYRSWGCHNLRRMEDSKWRRYQLWHLYTACNHYHQSQVRFQWMIGRRDWISLLDQHRKEYALHLLPSPSISSSPTRVAIALLIRIRLVFESRKNNAL